MSAMEIIGIATLLFTIGGFWILCARYAITTFNPKKGHFCFNHDEKREMWLFSFYFAAIFFAPISAWFMWLVDTRSDPSDKVLRTWKKLSRFVHAFVRVVCIPYTSYRFVRRLDHVHKLRDELLKKDAIWHRVNEEFGSYRLFAPGEDWSWYISVKEVRGQKTYTLKADALSVKRFSFKTLPENWKLPKIAQAA